MHENIFASLTANKAEALGIVKPFHCSLFHYVFPKLFLEFLLRRVAATERGDAERRNQLSTAWNQYKSRYCLDEELGIRIQNFLIGQEASAIQGKKPSCFCPVLVRAVPQPPRVNGVT